ncbi:MAG: FtsK/SpoIIIE domain-containing protein, partial [Naasia sp.]
GALAPVMAAVVLFAVTRSPFALAFAALGPLTAVAAVVDGRRQTRRLRRRDRRKREAAIAALAQEVQVELAERKRMAEADLPGTRELVSLPRPARALDQGAARRVRVGRADLDSGIRLPVHEPEDAGLAAVAGVLPDSPLVLDAAGGVGVIGSPALRSALAETVEAQLVWRAGRDSGIPRVVHAGAVEALPEHCAVLLEISAPRDARVLRSPDPSILGAFRPEIVSALERRSLTAGAASGSAIPEHVDLAGLPSPSLGGLTAVFAAGADGPVEIDLTRDGPHALVGGTTGSGKSELLVSWILALTRDRSPDEVGVVLFDFKGGAAFDPIADLPHVRGLVTDLDGAMVDRATAALGAELRSREARLRSAGARSADELPGLGRLVVVIDEFAALLTDRRELHDLFVDVAARGRSLGVHLILCTQRPAGVVRDSLAANCALRISLRVVDAADSAAVVGDDSASRIPRSTPGRCVVAIHGERPRELQVASLPRDAVSSVVAERVRTNRPASSPGWLPPLPASLPLRELPPLREPGAVRLGLSDAPEQASQPPAIWSPRVDGALAVVGAPGSGRTTAARTIAREAAGVLFGADGDPGRSAELLWDALTATHGGPLVVDDIDVLIDRMDTEHRMACLEMIPSAVRRRDRRVAVSVVSPTTPTARAVLAAFGSRLVLRAGSLDEHRLHAGPGPAYDPRVPPGGAVWRGMRTQVAIAPTADRPPVAPVPEVPVTADPDLLVISTSVDERLEQMRSRAIAVVDARDASSASGEDTAAAVGIRIIDPAGWHSAVGLWSLLGRRTTIYDRCAVADYRAVSRDRALPPVLDGADRVWLVEPGRPAARAIWRPGGTDGLP